MSSEAPAQAENMGPLFVVFGQEFADRNFSALNIHPNFSIQKNSKKGLLNNITLTVTAYNQTHDVVGKIICHFQNDEYKISPTHKLQKIPPGQLEEAFKSCKTAICQEIFQEMLSKVQKLNDKLGMLQAYAMGGEITPQEIPEDVMDDDDIYTEE